ncbi:hypothetical protein ACFU5O_28040 [Streptomyces sp. NPDC057445]|uniref:hypothetical protein n=1 Tax=Streptomyces sp. NPDC057445 TaxID=3346136 RepID=UPI003674C32C
MSTQPDDDEPEYEIRTVELPDGDRFTIAFKAGALDGVSDEELIARHQDFLDTALDDDTPLPAVEEADRDNVADLAQERLLRREQGTPFTAAELAPLLTDPVNHSAAAKLAAVLNTTQEAFRGSREGS